MEKGNIIGINNYTHFIPATKLNFVNVNSLASYLPGRVLDSR